ncbi:hypothetical protein Pint_05742 [Pistacia integerrima]|uniref:Uncharacterized protein n=1 Tax=Pistacia integerrima TaxID=434235 RepID=A0ACC0Z670_9ROSI|nr:hypothetical protein Pint_05742 [Pistacia integerrima]
MFEKAQTGEANDDLEPKLSSYEDFHPFAELTEDKDNNILSVYLPVPAAKDLEQAAVKSKGERQIMISAGVGALVGMAALAGAAFGAYVSCIIGSKS